METTADGRASSSSDVPAAVALAAVASRDRTFDGVVYYGVKTTRIYCRPSCPSRRPKRENVVLFTRAKEAEGDGYRPCRRCRPDSARGTTTELRLRAALACLDRHPKENLTLRQLGDIVGLSPSYLQRLFKERVGLSPRAYQDAKRLGSLKTRLREGEEVGRAVWSAGYGSTRGAYESAANGLGMTPGQYRRGAEGLRVGYSLHTTSFGRLLVGWTERGVCAVKLGDEDGRLVHELRDEFGGAEFEQVEAAPADWVRPILDYLEDAHPGLAVPLDLHGTVFQLRVWAALRQIPPGEVRSYAEVAEAIRAPKAARAVAQACAANRAAIVVPCHRVVRSDGGLGGYRFGPHRKRLLLDHERKLGRKET